MTIIVLKTMVDAPIAEVFDLARDIDAHLKSMDKSAEKAIAGVTSGKINLGETVTWKGKHFGLWLKHTSRITAMKSPDYFIDEMEKGHFKSFRHKHLFSTDNGHTMMTDELTYETPGGVIGKLFDKLILKNYLTKLLQRRNAALKAAAENQA